MIEKIKSFLFKNKTSSQTVAKNTVWLSISNFGGRIIKAVIVIYGARALGTAGWGVFSYAVTLAGFFTLFVDPGINAVLMRDASKGTEESRMTFFSTTLVIKTFLLATGLLFILFVAPSFSTLPGAKALLPIAALIFFFDTIREFFSSFIRAMEKMEWEAGIFLLTNAAIVGAAFLFLAYRPTVKSFGWGYVAGTAVGAVAAVYTLRKHLKKILSSFSARLVGPIMQSAWPFAVTGALGLLLTNTDIIIISWIKTASDVGIYSAAIRIIQVLYLVPMIMYFSTLPLFSRLAHENNEKFRRVFERVMESIFLISIPLAIGGGILGTQIMDLFFGTAYSAGGLAFKILVIALVVDYPAAILSTAIFAYDRQKNLIISSAIGGIANVVFDVVLIPRFGMTGSAVATLLAQTLSNGYLWYAMKRINNFTVLSRLKSIFIAGLGMGIVVLALFLAHVNVVVNILVGVLAYFALLKLMHEPILEQTISMVRSPTSAEPEASGSTIS